MTDADGTEPVPGSGSHRWLTALYRDTLWTAVLADLETHLCAATGARCLCLWLRIPPSGAWLRWAPDQPADVATRKPGMSALERRIREAGEHGIRVAVKALPAALRGGLREAGLETLWVVPLRAQLAGLAEERWEVLLGLAWSGEAPREPPILPMHLPSLWYLLKERFETEYTRVVADTAVALGTPAHAADWRERMSALLELLGGDDWALYQVTLNDKARAGGAQIQLLAELGTTDARGKRLVAFMTDHPDRFEASALMQAVRYGHTVFVPDILKTGYAVPEAYGGEPVRSGFVIPLGMQPEGAFGLLGVYWREPNGWRELGLSFHPWEALRRHTAEWWQSMPLARYAVSDSLTGLLNRRGLAEAWQAEIRTWTAGMLGVVDADYFSDVNNRWGHLVGDAALRTVADSARAIAEEGGGVAARWGGDEFVLCLPGPVDWQEIGKELCRTTNHSAYERGLPVRIGLSGGAMSWQGPVPDLDDAFFRADTLLLDAKRQGRARFLTSEPVSGSYADPLAQEHGSVRKPGS